MAFFVSDQDPAQLSEVYYQNAVLTDGPTLPQKNFEEFSRTELRIHITYVRVALVTAVNNNDLDAVPGLLKKYDEAFVALFSADPVYRQKFIDGKVGYLRYDRTRTRKYYLSLVNAL